MKIKYKMGYTATLLFSLIFLVLMMIEYSFLVPPCAGYQVYTMECSRLENSVFIFCLINSGAFTLVANLIYRKLK